LQFSTHLKRVCISRFLRKIWAVKFAVKLQSPKKVVSGERDAPDFGTYFQIALTYEHEAGFSRVPLEGSCHTKEEDA